ncbi:MAG: transposase, partial [Rhodoplanes sp.]
CKAPFAGPEQVLRYLSRYTHRVAISNRRLVAADDAGIAFRWKDYRINGPGRWRTMRLHPHEFPSRWGCCHPHPSQFRTCRFPASGSSRASFAHVGVAMDNPSSRQWIPF